MHVLPAGHLQFGLPVGAPYFLLLIAGWPLFIAAMQWGPFLLSNIITLTVTLMTVIPTGFWNPFMTPSGTVSP